MKRSETCVAQDELQGVAEKLEAPISLTPEQLETIAGGYWLREIPGRPVIFGFVPVHYVPPALPKTIYGVIIRGPLEV